VTFAEQLLIDLFDFFVKIGSARVELDPKVLVVICLQLIEIDTSREVFLTRFVQIKLTLKEFIRQ